MPSNSTLVFSFLLLNSKPPFNFLNKSMAELSIKSFQLFRRSYAVAAENMKVKPVASVVRKAADLRAEISVKQKETFWMRDPKTGNWIPENHFGDADVAEMREKFLSKKQKSSCKDLSSKP